MKQYKYIGETDEFTTNGKIYNVKTDGTFIDDTNTRCCLGNDYQKYFESVNPNIINKKEAKESFAIDFYEWRSTCLVKNIDQYTNKEAMEMFKKHRE